MRYVALAVYGSESNPSVIRRGAKASTVSYARAAFADNRVISRVTVTDFQTGQEVLRLSRTPEYAPFQRSDWNL